jgi:AraC-like DNA-binding protein
VLSSRTHLFVSVLHEIRCDLARSWLRAGGSHTLSGIAFPPAFADSSAFSGAFHRWTGVAPSAFGG